MVVQASAVDVKKCELNLSPPAIRETHISNASLSPEVVDEKGGPCRGCWPELSRVREGGSAVRRGGDWARSWAARGSSGCRRCGGRAAREGPPPEHRQRQQKAQPQRGACGRGLRSGPCRAPSKQRSLGPHNLAVRVLLQTIVYKRHRPLCGGVSAVGRGGCRGFTAGSVPSGRLFPPSQAGSHFPAEVLLLAKRWDSAQRDRCKEMDTPVGGTGVKTPLCSAPCLDASPSVTSRSAESRAVLMLQTIPFPTQLAFNNSPVKQG
ncbi:uncharacterized protein LOC129735348 [Falco cherrug]|uniref:uncharacterized protein LOC129735348 n=1 Tax=Falco cherrug TaxID=345164 RepID=UPI00247908C4|nr:uncharacterized protein LOC129735348 [Falco cherrug]